MARFVALLRGVMPSNANMGALRTAFEHAGFERVKTVLGSGNVVFDTSLATENDIEQAAENAMTQILGRSFYTIVRSSTYLSELIELDPYASHGIPIDAKRVVSFMRDAQSPKVALPLAQHHASVFLHRDREIFTAYTPTDKGPVFMNLIEQAFGKNVTTRTLDTLKKCAIA